LHLLLQLMRMLERIHFYDELPRKWVFVHTHDAVRAALDALDGGETGGSVVLIADDADAPKAKAAAGSFDAHNQ
jgi:nucleoside-diphosphate-sugar epimerase